MIDINTIKLPTHFSKLETDGESRFIPVKIYIAHTGENLNNSIFSKDVLESMIPTLTNIPILGYVATNKNGEDDFRGHEKNISIEGTSININYKTHAYGFIPEENNAHFEVTGGKEWLVANGYLWSRFIDVLKIFNESGGTKGQSMEVSHADGYTDQYGRVVYTSAQFEGLCILGDDVPPAMTGSVISTEFSKADFKSAFKEMLAEFSAEKGEYALATKKKEKDDAVVVEDDKKASSASTAASSAAKPAESSATSSASKPAEQPAKDDGKKAAEPASTASAEPKETEKPASTSSEDKAPAASEDKGAQDSAASASTDSSDSDSSEDDTAEMACGPKKKKSASMAKDETASKDKEENTDDADDTDDSSDDTNDKDKKFACGGSKKDKKAQMACGDSKKKKFEFELNLNQKQHAFIDAVREKYFAGTEWSWLECAYDNYGIVGTSNNEEDKPHFYHIDYTVNADDSIQLGGKTEVFPTYLTATEKAEVEENREKVADLQAQLKELEAYKNGVEMSKKEALLKDNAQDLTTEQVENIKSQFSQLTTEDVEKEIAYAIFETQKNNKKQFGHGMRAANFSADKKGLGYGTADILFKKR